MLGLVENLWFSFNLYITNPSSFIKTIWRNDDRKLFSFRKLSLIDSLNLLIVIKINLCNPLLKSSTKHIEFLPNCTSILWKIWIQFLIKNWFKIGNEKENLKVASAEVSSLHLLSKTIRSLWLFLVAIAENNFCHEESFVKSLVFSW